MNRWRNAGPRSGLLLVLSMLCVLGCEDREFFVPADVGVPVVDAVLVVDRPFPRVYVTRTLSPQEPFAFTSAGESAAEVWIESGDVEVRYDESSLVPGAYTPRPGAPLVEPGRSYTLRVRTDAGEAISATTFTPARLDVSEWLLLENDATTVCRRLLDYEEAGAAIYDAPENQITYNEGLLEARFVRSEAVSLQVALFSLDPGSDFVIDPDFFEEDDFEDLERENYSPMFLGEDGFVRLPWFAIYFEGRYQIKVWSVDRNWNDLVRSSPSLNQGAGFGGNAGDGFERPIFHVEGGFGLFGSAAVDSVGFRILPSASRD